MAENNPTGQGGQEAEEIPMARVWQPEPPVPSLPPPPLSLPMPAPLPTYPPPPYGLPSYASQMSGYGGGYAFARPMKPGVVTTIGVVSIVMAVLSIIGSAVGAVQAIMQAAMIQMSQVMATVQAQQAAQQAAQAAASDPVAVGSDGLGFDERQGGGNVMAALQPPD